MASGWRIVGQRQTEELTPSGTFVSVFKVQFQLDDGTLGTETIPANLYTPDYVAQAIDKRAQTMHAINNLTGQV